MDNIRREMERKQLHIDSLTAQLESQKEEAAQQLAEVTAARDRYRQELMAVQHFKREKAALEQELTRLRENEAALKAKNERELSRLRYQSLEEKVRLKNAELAMEQRFHHDVEARAYELLDEKVKAIHQQNKTLLEDKLMLEKELEQLMSLTKRRDDDLRTNQRDLDLQQQSLLESAKQGCRMHREVKELQTKVTTLEETLESTIRRYEQEKAEKQRAYEKTLAHREQQIAEAHHLLELRTQELQRIRSLAQHIVGARSELEAFFNEALEYVRQQMALEESKGGAKAKAHPSPQVVISSPKKSGSTGSSGGDLGRLHPYTPESAASDFLDGFEPILLTSRSSDADSLPPITPGGAQSRRPPTRRVDISELSWADKERVLRILFAKINNLPGKPLGKKKAAGSFGNTSFKIDS